MTPAEIVHRLRLAGLNPFLDADGELRADGPSDAYSPELRALVGKHRAEVVGLLRSEGLPAESSNDSEGTPPRHSGQSGQTPPEVSPTDGMTESAAERIVARRLQEALAAEWVENPPGCWTRTDYADVEIVPAWTCSQCGSGEGWQSLTGAWRCTRCDPPRGSAIRAEAARLRTKAGRR